MRGGWLFVARPGTAGGGRAHPGGRERRSPRRAPGPAPSNVKAKAAGAAPRARGGGRGRGRGRGGGGGDARRSGVRQPSAAACCFVSFRNTFPSPRKVSGAFAGVSSPGAPGGASPAHAVPPGAPGRAPARLLRVAVGSWFVSEDAARARVLGHWPVRALRATCPIHKLQL